MRWLFRQRRMWRVLLFAGRYAMDKRVKGFDMHPTSYLFGEELAIES